MRSLFFGLLAILVLPVWAQSVNQRLAAAIAALLKDEQFNHATLSMYVLNAKTGEVIYEKEPQLGVAPASTQKVITSASAFELLGSGFSFSTRISYDGRIESGKLIGNLYISGSGDPSLGSWRWTETSGEAVLKKVVSFLKAKQITNISGNIVADTRHWESQATPRGWIWEDVGNYFGSGARAINWHENQYDLILKPGSKVGDNVSIIKTDPLVPGIIFTNELKTGKEGSGDNSIIYLAENCSLAVVRGTVPAGKESFTVKGSVPDAPNFFLQSLEAGLLKNAIPITGKLITDFFPAGNVKQTDLGILRSPDLASLNSWFLQKSINLYGEAFVKAIAFEKKGFGATDSGLAIIRYFWSQRGIEKEALKMLDGSGLSPANRITTHALVTVLQYAKKQQWYPAFYDALPQINGIKMKDGYINGVRAYAGYISSKEGTEYCFAFVVNNFDGSPGTAREKMWDVLNILK